MNWGYKILTIYIIFVAGILFLVFKSSFQNQDLVVPDYYEQELKFQQRIDETERANALSTEVKYMIREKDIIISLPPEMKGISVSAHVWLYCTADKRKDIQQNLVTQDGEIKLAFPPANKGLHELKVNWVANEKSYYYEHKIFIQ
jgi:nitrogen fixation protein FixH